MSPGVRGEIVLAMAWLLFPMLPVILEEFYYQLCVNLLGSTRAGPDPHAWAWGTWLVMLGPLVGYGFLAGSTAEVPDEVSGPKKGLRRVLARRAVWVAIGPWAGFLFVLAAFLGFGYLSSWFPPPQDQNVPRPSSATQASVVLTWVWSVSVLGIFAYGWLWPAWAALRRAGRIGPWRRALYRGLVTAVAFVGSLFGSFWAITSAWRSFFFDKRLMPMVALAMSLMVLSGCAAPITYGDTRRRELFHAMLLAWVFGLALSGGGRVGAGAGLRRVEMRIPPRLAQVEGPCRPIDGGYGPVRGVRSPSGRESQRGGGSEHGDAAGAEHRAGRRAGAGIRAGPCVRVDGGGRGAGPGAGAASGMTLDGLLRMSPAELERDLQPGSGGGSPAGPGARDGLAGTRDLARRPMSRGARLMWQGKIIEPDGATAVNRFFGMRMIRGELGQGPSWLDGAPALILDYSQTSRIYARNRDEIRQVAPGLFLGLMYDRSTEPPRLSMYFALETTD